MRLGRAGMAAAAASSWPRAMEQLAAGYRGATAPPGLLRPSLAARAS